MFLSHSSQPAVAFIYRHCADSHSVRCSARWPCRFSSCIDVMTNSLRDAMSKISDIIDLDLVPFGNGSGQHTGMNGEGRC
jgi:hypothetical protein